MNVLVAVELTLISAASQFQDAASEQINISDNLVNLGQRPHLRHRRRLPQRSIVLDLNIKTDDIRSTIASPTS